MLLLLYWQHSSGRFSAKGHDRGFKLVQSSFCTLKLNYTLFGYGRARGFWPAPQYFSHLIIKKYIHYEYSTFSFSFECDQWQDDQLPGLLHPDAVYHNGEPSDEHPPKELHLFVLVETHKPTDFKACDTITNTTKKQRSWKKIHDDILTKIERILWHALFLVNNLQVIMRTHSREQKLKNKSTLILIKKSGLVCLPSHSCSLTECQGITVHKP